MYFLKIQIQHEKKWKEIAFLHLCFMFFSSLIYQSSYWNVATPQFYKQETQFKLLKCL